MLRGPVHMVDCFGNCSQQTYDIQIPVSKSPLTDIEIIVSFQSKWLKNQSLYIETDEIFGFNQTTFGFGIFYVVCLQES